MPPRRQPQRTSLGRVAVVPPLQTERSSLITLVLDNVLVPRARMARVQTHVVVNTNGGFGANVLTVTRIRALESVFGRFLRQLRRRYAGISDVTLEITDVESNLSFFRRRRTQRLDTIDKTIITSMLTQAQSGNVNDFNLQGLKIIFHIVPHQG